MRGGEVETHSGTLKRKKEKENHQPTQTHNRYLTCSESAAAREFAIDCLTTHWAGIWRQHDFFRGQRFVIGAFGVSTANEFET